MDVMEMVNGDGTSYSTYHWQDGYPTTRCAYPKHHHHIFAQANLSEGWNRTLHEFSVERGTRHIAFALDGRVLLNASSPEASFVNTSWYVILNTAIGGGWPGSPTPDTVFPIKHQIDYVRVARPRTRTR